MKTYREKSDRDSFSIPSAWTSAPTLPAPTHASLLMQQVEALEAAKRRAAASYTRMVAHPMPQDMAQTTRDEQEVLCARVAVLNALLEQTAEHSPLCLEATGRERPRVCVTYDRLRCDGELELGPMQSTMAWVVRDAEDPVTQLMSCPDDHPPASVVNGLLDLIRKSAPKKDILQGLHSALTLPPPERLVLKSLRGVNAPEHDGHARVYEGLGESASGPVPPLYRVIWGALDLHVLEGWQNPSTNAAIRLSILDAAHQAAREAQRTKAPLWSNVAYLQVRIYHGEECHRLSLRPFWDSESCTVSHIQFRQSVFDESGPERGLLNLSQDPTTIHSIPMGTILPLQAYVCLGAHRKNRLNEAQLNYVHAQGLLAHRFDVRLLPDPGLLLQTPSGKMVPAKATRVSGDKLDVMASSYHIADQVYTTISVVQYPPFGTQFERSEKTGIQHKSVQNKERSRLAMENSEAPEWGDDSAWDDSVMIPEYDYEDASDEEDYQPVHTNNHGTSSRRDFKPTAKRQTQNILYLQERPRIYDKYDGPKKKRWYTGSLEFGQFFFVDGVYGDPFDLKNRIILFDFDQDDPRFLDMEREAKRICVNLRKTHGDIWDPELSFYGNVFLGKKTALAQHGNSGMYLATTIGREWSLRWSAVIKDEIELRQSMGKVRPDGKNDDGQDYNHDAAIFASGGWGHGNSNNFWYCANPDIWQTILAGTTYASDYQQWSARKVNNFKLTGDIPQALMSRLEALSPPATFLEKDQLPLPLTRLSARTAGKDPAVDQLKSRITALEGRLDRGRQEENTQFLLCKVLEKLEAVEEV